MDELTLAFGMVGIAGALVSVVVAILPEIRDRYYDSRNIPLKVSVVRTFLKVNPAFGGRIRIRVYNRIRGAVSVQISPLTKTESYTDPEGKLLMRGVLVHQPSIRIYPDGTDGGSFWLPGRDSREVEIALPIREGVLRGAEDLTPVVFANRFVAQEIRLGPFRLEVDPTHV